MFFELTQEEGELLVHLARKSVEHYLKTHKRASTPTDLPKKLLQCSGVFVTINELINGGKELRGCIGYPYPVSPLAEALIESAIDAATRDPRFEPLKEQELGKTVFEVSVLTPPEKVEVKSPIEYIGQIKIGEHGLIIERSGWKGLLLPQVPTEYHWNEEEFLCQCCLKAGLPPDSWLAPGTKVYRFSAVIAQETSPGGPVRLYDMRKGERPED